MDNKSLFSGPKNDLPESNGEVSLPEESGWTQYLEDFSSYSTHKKEEEEEEEERADNSSGFVSGSLVSDAGSGPEWKSRIANSIVSGLPSMQRKLNSKDKRITREVPFDDSLEDTASSLVNSPKIAMGFNGMDVSSRKKDENFVGYLGEGGARDYHAAMKKNDGCAEMKKRRLCLVPVSMGMNYFG
ncbi:hypothetical protein Nepgr_013892 [Nepenthes gracilis]|uniref:Uncharacterized protein n=1 Tax=Nepenthes gracilis TaxID=150966 RepID=A0AAD3SJZ3_NEPGR|nr:hypothetical protein Nepgr_013892 [Nepenthes gracilis]